MKRLVCANWKMNGTEEEAGALVAALLPRLRPLLHRVEVALAPPFTSLKSVGEAIRGSGIALASQNVHSAPKGAFTGEISTAMLVSLGVRYAIVGHSERRRIFGETSEDAGRKVVAAAAAGLIPILCVGEEESERLLGRTMDVIEAQLTAGIAGLERVTAEGLVVAYEPVWAIGTGRTATPGQAVEAHQTIREILARRAGKEEAGRIRILYGGSATAETMPGLAVSPGIDGGLVGGASLVADSFASIVRAVAAGGGA
jgi:triosephosphate isomerase (TIM)